MATQNIVDYLRENKDKFPREVLEKKLIERGYPNGQIEEGTRIVYEEITTPQAFSEIPRKTSFWDFKSIKVYTNFGEKLLDFLFGVFSPIIIAIMGGKYFLSTYSLFGFLCVLLLILIAAIFGIFYFWKRRHYFSRGLLFCLALPFIVILIGLFFFFSIFRF